MTLLDFCLQSEQYEIEVVDKEVDISAPYYFIEHPSYEDTEEDHFLFLMEKWFLSLPVDEVISDTTVSVDVYSQVEDKVKDPADYTESVFLCLSQGYYNFAKRFCEKFNLA